MSHNNFIPVSDHAIHLNSVPKGSGFWRMKEIFGKPSVLFFLGCQADINSSKTFMKGAAITVLRFLLNSSIKLDSMHHGSSALFLLSKSANTLGKYVFISSNHLGDMKGLRSIEGDMQNTPPFVFHPPFQREAFHLFLWFQKKWWYQRKWKILFLILVWFGKHQLYSLTWSYTCFQ